ncbi:aa_trans domain-containing protein [Trichonephila clavata]|uniref:Aa_trans domain-containing protein n=1 Tax=Trichonephila clavata TaxID=2740835 RepID=A0A8X6LE84_TRICU|nr:aa_trans domain-containing protein [Trichonephila clavata]
MAHLGQKYERKVKGIPGKNTRKEGLSIWTGALFLLATMSGRGILALPSAFLGTGLIGILLLTFLCVNSLYSVQCLGACWSILEERYEEYRIKKSRRPYASIAYRASGKIMQHFVSFCLIINLLGVAIVYLLLSSEITESVVDGKGLSYCNWIIIFAVIFCPMLWLGTPDDFW